MPKKIGRIKSLEDVPQEVSKLPEHAQHIYLKAHNEALALYKDPERRGGESRDKLAHKVAWEIIKEKYTRRGNKWVRRS